MGERISLGAWITYMMMSYLTVMDLRNSDVYGITLPPIYWNISNPMFKSSLNEPSVEVHLDDQIDFVCPYNPSPVTPPPQLNAASLTPSTYSTTTIPYNVTISENEFTELTTVTSTTFNPSLSPLRDEYYILYQVSKKSYDACRLNDEARVLLNCSNPKSPKRFTVLFELFQSIPNAPEFRYGQSYYYISTSRGDLEGLLNTDQGACKSHNLKLVVHVCCKTNPAITTIISSSTTFNERNSTSFSTTSSTISTTSSTQYTPSTTSNRSTVSIPRTEISTGGPSSTILSEVLMSSPTTRSPATYNPLSHNGGLTGHRIDLTALTTTMLLASCIVLYNFALRAPLNNYLSR